MVAFWTRTQLVFIARFSDTAEVADRLCTAKAAKARCTGIGGRAPYEKTQCLRCHASTMCVGF
eukprot:5745990-Amphidinium_carterae.1